MRQLVVIFLIVMVMAISVKTQEVSIYGGRAQLPISSDGGGGGNEGGGNESGNEGGNDEVQDESELASALGVDRQALYEDLMRIHEELGGSPLSDQPSNENTEDY